MQPQQLLRHVMGILALILCVEIVQTTVNESVIQHRLRIGSVSYCQIDYIRFKDH